MTLPAAARIRFDRHRAYLAEHEPGLVLELDERSRRAKIVGTLQVPAGGGVVRDIKIEIRYNRLDPLRTPETYDPVRRFPPAADRHVECDGQFCLWLPQTEPGDFGTEHGLALHLDRVREFLVLQFMYEVRRARNISPAWPGKAWGHGVDGYEEWIREKLAGLPPCNLMVFRRDLVRGRGATSPDTPCPCRSARSFRTCHRPFTELMKRQARKHPGLSAALVRVLKEPA